MFGLKKKKAAEPAFDPIKHINEAVVKASDYMPAHQMAAVLQEIAQRCEISAAVGCGSRQPWTNGNGIPPLQFFRQEPKKYEGLAEVIRGGPRR
jgi:hypothetical protein